MDTISKEKRSWNMGRIKSKDTIPELFVRSLLHRAGYRFRLHIKDLPGKPDIVLPKYNAIIEIRGCFWHYHENCIHGKIPATNYDWWKKKLQENVQRDIRHINELIAMGWRVLIIWECLIKGQKKDTLRQLSPVLLSAAVDFLLSSNKLAEISSNLFAISPEIKSPAIRNDGDNHAI